MTIPHRRPIDAEVDRLTMLLRTSATNETRLRYARDLIAKRRERGDFAPVVQEPMSAELVEALVRNQAQALEALRAHADGAGERTDD